MTTPTTAALRRECRRLARALFREAGPGGRLRAVSFDLYEGLSRAGDFASVWTSVGPRVSAMGSSPVAALTKLAAKLLRLLEARMRADAKALAAVGEGRAKGAVTR